MLTNFARCDPRCACKCPRARWQGLGTAPPLHDLHGEALTIRGYHEMANMVYYSSLYKKAVKKEGLPRGRVLSTAFAEWQMGLPRGWTSTKAAATRIPRLPFGRARVLVNMG